MSAPAPPVPRERTKESISQQVRALRLQSSSLPTGRSNSGRLGWVVSVVLVGVVAYLLMRGDRPSAKPGSVAANPSTASQPASLSTAGTNKKTAETAVATGGVVLEAKGYVIPERQILVSPQVSGRILELNFREGMRIQQGDVLARLESIDYRADYERVSANLAAAQERLVELLEGSLPEEIRQVTAEVAEAEANLEQAKRTYLRNKDLHQQKFVNDQELEESRTQFQAQTQRVERLRAGQKLMVDGPRKERKRAGQAEVRLYEAELEKAQWRLNNCTIVAPITGTILKKNAEQGNIVNPVAFNGSFSLCDMADLSRLEVDLSVQERDIAKVFVNQRCKVRAEAFMDRVYEGVVSRLMPIADRAKGAVPVRVQITIPSDEEGKYLKPEMSALVTFFSDAAPAATSPVPPSFTTTQPADAAATADAPATLNVPRE